MILIQLRVPGFTVKQCNSAPERFRLFGPGKLSGLTRGALQCSGAYSAIIEDLELYNKRLFKQIERTRSPGPFQARGRLVTSMWRLYPNSAASCAERFDDGDQQTVEHSKIGP